MSASGEGNVVSPTDVSSDTTATKSPDASLNSPTGKSEMDASLAGTGHDGKLPSNVTGRKIAKILEVSPPTEKELECVAFLKHCVEEERLRASQLSEVPEEAAAKTDKKAKKDSKEDVQTPALPLEGDEEFLSDTTYLRFTRAREAKKEKAWKMLAGALRWRRSYKPHQVFYDDVKDVLSMGTTFQHGMCKDGRAIIYMTPGKSSSFPAEQRIKCLVYLLENSTRQGFDQLTWVFDWSQMGDRGKDDESTKTRELATTLLQDYYPERLGKLLMVDTPWYYSVLYSIASVFMQARTTNKIHDVKNKHVIKHVDEEFLLKQFRAGMSEPPVKRMAASEMPVLKND